MRCPTCDRWNDVIHREPVRQRVSPFPLEESSATVQVIYRWECRYCGTQHQMRGLTVEKSFPKATPAP